MTRTLRSLARVNIALSLGLAIYSFSQFSAGFSPTDRLTLLLCTAGTALGLALLIVALAVNAQAQRWSWFSVYLVLALVTIFGPVLLLWLTAFSIWFPSFSALLPNGDVYLQWEVLTYSGPPMATALLVLVEESRNRLQQFSLGLTEDKADDLEVTPLND
jgi:hypothetical protein